MRINSYSALDVIKTGKFVCIKSQETKFFSLITDIKLEITNPDILLYPPTETEPFLKEILLSKHIYATANLRPMISLSFDGKVSSTRTIPIHFSNVYQATKDDISLIFGDEKDKKYFPIGSPIDMQANVCIDLEKLVERSNGIFGKTGTGKTFLSRLVLAGLIHNNKAVNLIFDMHGEYGDQARKEGVGKSFVKGLKTLFSNKVAIFSLDPISTRRRGSAPDVELTIGYNEISVEDIISLDTELNLHSTAYEAAYLIYAKYKKSWLEVFLSQGDRLKDFAADVGAHPESIAALYRKLKAIERLPFIKSQSSNIVTQMIEYIQRDISIIVEFGNFTSTFCYLLVANIITRHIHNLYIEKTEKFLSSQKKADEPKKLMITIEEAHKFLNTQAARQTIFGIIAREMRKYYVTLLVVDQRPSGIDPEIISQIGTKIIAQLNDEKDVQAVLSGTNNSSQLRNILSGLETKKQVLLLGHAVPMPVVIQTREYDEDFYKAMQLDDILPADKALEQIYY